MNLNNLRSGHFSIYPSKKVKGTYNIIIFKGILGYEFAWKPYKKHIIESELNKEIETVKQILNDYLKWSN